MSFKIKNLREFSCSGLIPAALVLSVSIHDLRGDSDSTFGMEGSASSFLVENKNTGDTPSCQPSDKETPAANSIRVINGSASFDEQGQLYDMTFDKESWLAEALEKAMDVLARSNPDILQVVKHDCAALVVSDASQSRVTLHSSEKLNEPLVVIIIPEQGSEKIEIVSDDFANSIGTLETLETSAFPKKLNVVGLMTMGQQPVSDTVVQSLQEAIDGMSYESLRSNLPQLGQVGEPAWEQINEYQRRIAEELTETVTTPAQPINLKIIHWPFYGNAFGNIQGYHGRLCTPDIAISIEKGMTGSDCLERINAFFKYIEMGHAVNHKISRNMLRDVRFVLPSSHVDLLRLSQASNVKDGSPLLRDLRAYLEEDNLDRFFNEQIVSEDNLDRDIKITKKVPRGPSHWESLRGSLRAFGASAAIGGGISAGVSVYDRYRKDGALPHYYTKNELTKLVRHTVQDSVRHGASGALTFNLQRVTGLPAPVVGAGMGVMNSLYNSYQAGELTQNNAASIALKSGMESSVASAGGWMAAAAAASFVPGVGTTTPVQISSALVGSLAGHYVYQRIMSGIPVD